MSRHVVGAYSTSSGASAGFDTAVITNAQVAGLKTASNTFSSATTGGKGLARTDYGTNHAYARASVAADLSNSANATAETTATSMWTDSLTLNKAGLAVTIGTASYSFSVDGSILGNIATYKALRRFKVYQDGNLVGQLINSMKDSSYNETLTTAPFAITYGKPFTLSVSLEAYAYRFENTIDVLKTSTTDYQNTATFTSISAFDAGSAPVTGASYTATSGTTSYTLVGGATVISESATLALVGVGLLGGVLIRGRK